MDPKQVIEPNQKPVFGVTLGDPLGIGPEVVRKALRDPAIRRLAEWRVFGKDRVSQKITRKKAGIISYAVLEEATQALRKGEVFGLVTAPVCKAHLQMAGFRYPGQTEYLAHRFKVRRVAMMLASSYLKVVLVTIHISLRDVFRHLSSPLILEKIVLTYQSLRNDFGIKKPRLAVCGLNPHAGEGGLIGSEEKKIILPAIRKAQKKGIKVSGPYPPDAVFHTAIKGDFDAVICHYHDQGLIPLKTVAFNEGVNVTLGLPIVRTSPDHGCAFDIAGKGIANPSSMKAAMKMAVEIWKNRNL